MDADKLARAAALEAEAAALRRNAFDMRPLPDFWRVGQKVRTLNHKEFAWDAGAVMTVIEVREPHVPASKYQVFFTSGGYGRYWTTPAEVELVEDVPATETA